MYISLSLPSHRHNHPPKTKQENKKEKSNCPHPFSFPFTLQILQLPTPTTRSYAQSATVNQSPPSPGRRNRKKRKKKELGVLSRISSLIKIPTYHSLTIPCHTVAYHAHLCSPPRFPSLIAHRSSSHFNYAREAAAAAAAEQLLPVPARTYTHQLTCIAFDRNRYRYIRVCLGVDDDVDDGFFSLRQKMVMTCIWYIIIQLTTPPPPFQTPKPQFQIPFVNPPPPPKKKLIFFFLGIRWCRAVIHIYSE